MARPQYTPFRRQDKGTEGERWDHNLTQVMSHTATSETLKGIYFRYKRA